MANLTLEVFSIGHSTLPYEDFLNLLRHASITAVADVRSSPFSRFCPHFNKDVLREELRHDGISYVYLGQELGGRPKRDDFFVNGIADYEKMATAPDFEIGLRRVIDGAAKHRIAMMCSESDPLECHRCLLVGRALSERGVTIHHILTHGKILGHKKLEEKLMDLSGVSEFDLFDSPEKRLADAYRSWSMKVAYSPQTVNSGLSVAVE